jgi:hypothetical protein
MSATSSVLPPQLSKTGPNSLKQLLRFLARAEDMDHKNLIAAFYARLYVSDKVINLINDPVDGPEIRRFATQLVNATGVHYMQRIVLF